jgi:excisionase family DNA binding protein
MMAKSAVDSAFREVMDIRQAAEYLQINAYTLYRYANSGFVPSFRLGNRWRFKRSILDMWIVKTSREEAAKRRSHR